MSRRPNPEARARIMTAAFWRDEVASLLERGRRAGFFRSDLAPRGAAEAILAIFEGSLLFAKVHKTTEAILSARRMAVGYPEAFRA